LWPRELLPTNFWPSGNACQPTIVSSAWWTAYARPARLLNKLQQQLV